MAQIAQQPISVQGAGRTDAGVHALGQVFSCDWPEPPSHRLRHALSTMLRPDASVTELREVPADFNARFSARAKRYAYSLDLGRDADPLAARYAWHVPYALDLDRIRSLLPTVIGTHDFAGFQSTGTQMKTTVRTIFDAQLLPGAAIGPMDGTGQWRIEFFGDGFLYKMVRNLTGTLVEIARGRFPPEFFAECLASPGPFLGHCAPAHGLAMVRVFYDGDEGCPADKHNTPQ